jgi:hypothetical protein
MVITFCKNKCCPVVEVVDDKIILGDANGPEGTTVWTKQNMRDFVDAAKEGKFDALLAEKCPCGEKLATDCQPNSCFDPA